MIRTIMMKDSLSAFSYTDPRKKEAPLPAEDKLDKLLGEKLEAFAKKLGNYYMPMHV